MKQWILGILLLLCSAMSFAQSDDFKSLSHEDQELLNNVIGLVDQGLSEAVVPDFDYLAKKYPKNYVVQYERTYNLYMLGRYDEVLKNSKFLLKHKNAEEQTFQLIGNAYDITGNHKKAIKTYEEGLKRFPQSGSLYMEIGTVYLLNNDVVKALEYYNRGVMAQPNFASNYYRAAKIFLSSEGGKVWGLVYAETAVLLAPSKDDRHEEMANMIIDCLKEGIRMSFDGKPKLSVKFVPGRDIRIDEKTKEVYVAFPGIYEAALGRPLMKMLQEKVPFTATLPQLIEIRKGLVENYFSATDNLYGNSMYLLEFQKKIIDAGHWDAYNYFLFMPSFQEEFDEWYSANSAAFDEFTEWYNNAPFTLGDGRSVDPMQIFNNYRPIDMFQSLMIQGELLGLDSPSEDKEESEE